MINKVILIGNVGRDPEVRHSTNGDAVANISVATTEKWKDRDGEKHEHTEWHRVVFFGRLAEVAGEYLEKGSRVYVEGKLKTRKWTDKDGVEKYTTEIEARELKLLSFRENDSGGRGNSEGRDDREDRDDRRPAQRRDSRPEPRRETARREPARRAEISDEDIPF